MHLRTCTNRAPDAISRSSLHTALVHPFKVTPVKSKYATAWAEETGYLRALFNSMLARTTGFVDAKMAWTAASFQKRVFLRFDVKAVGWPPEIVFRNPKYFRMEEVRLLIDLCLSGELYFTHASDDELAAAERDVAHACPGVLFPIPVPDLGRRDVGRQQPRYNAEGNLEPRRYERNGPKSAKWVDDAEDNGVDGAPTTSGPLPPRPMMFKNRTWMVWHEPTGCWRVPTAAELDGYLHTE